MTTENTKSQDGDAASSLPSSDLLEIEVLNRYAIMPPEGFDKDFRASQSIALSEEGAWFKFCNPALNRKAYEADGFKPVKLRVGISISNSVISETAKDKSD